MFVRISERRAEETMFDLAVLRGHRFEEHASCPAQPPEGAREA